MTDIYSLTAQLENAQFLHSDGKADNLSIPPRPFYLDSGGVNFGYGVKIPPSQNALVLSLLTGAGVNPQAIEALQSYLKGQSPVSSINTALASDVDWRPAAYQAMQDFYTTIAVPGIARAVGSSLFDTLHATAQSGLSMLAYNAGTGFLGPRLKACLRGQDYAAAAYELAFATAAVGDQAYQDRALIGAGLMLGFDVGIGGDNSIRSLTPSGDVGASVTSAFLDLIHARNPSAQLQTLPVQAFISSLNIYLKNEGPNAGRPAPSRSPFPPPPGQAIG